MPAPPILRARAWILFLTQLPTLWPWTCLFRLHKPLCPQGKWAQCWVLGGIGMIVAERGTPSRAQEWALAFHSEMNCPRTWIPDTCWQSKRLYWEGAPGWRAAGKGTQEDCSAMWLKVLGFMVMGWVSGLSLASHSDSGSFLVAHASLSQNGSQRGGF